MRRLKILLKPPRIKNFKPREIDEIKNIALKDIIQHTPEDTGQLKRGIRARKVNGAIEIYIQGKRNNEVAKFLIEGTKDHMIRPVKAKALAWTSGGRTLFSMGHMVRGIKKGYWKFAPSKAALDKITARIKSILKGK